MPEAPLNILVVSRQAEWAERLKGLFPGRQVRTRWDSGIDRILEYFESETFDVLVITSAVFNRGRNDWIEVLEVIADQCSCTQVLFLVETRNIQAISSVLRAGTYQYLREPVSDEELRLVVLSALQQRPSLRSNQMLKASDTAQAYPQLVGRSRAMQGLFRQIRQAAATDIPVLLLGETGTGKDLAAQAIHQQSGRSRCPYVPVNVGALPSELVGSELFGYEKGAFTGAVEARPGMFEQGHGGTVFLDEIGAVDERTQISLLRLLEQRNFYRLGGKRLVTCDTRLVAATNADLPEMVRKGLFREDLFYRLDVFHIDLPPLRERAGDIPLLVEEFMRRYARSFHKDIQGIAPECIGIMESYDWPGNVRELKNAIQRAVVVCEGPVIKKQHLLSRISSGRAEPPVVCFEVGTPIAEIEREMILRTLEATANNRKRSAEMLGISRRALYNKLQKYGIA